MAIAYERNTDLAFNTEVFKKAAQNYKDIASELRSMANKLDKLLTELKKVAGLHQREQHFMQW